MDCDALTDWLRERGGPIVRYRTAVDLARDVPASVREQLEAEMLSSPAVRQALECLVPRLGLGQMHSSKRNAYENAMGRLILLGCRAGMAPLDDRTRPFRDWLAEYVAHPPELPLRYLYAAIVAAFLAMAGYRRDEAVRAVLLERLAITASFCRGGRYDIYVDHRSYPGYPQGFSRRRLIDPAICGPHVGRLPSIHDLNGLAALLEGSDDAALQGDLAAVVGYVLHPAYHAFEDGYGVVWAGGHKFYALGWDAQVPGFDRFEEPGRMTCLLLRLMTMARIPAARSHPWFGAALEHLESFRTERGTYRFPTEYLINREGYWVSGYGMGLGENRRSPLAREIESTFWRLWIGQLAGER